MAMAGFWENVFFFPNTDIKWKVFIMSVYSDLQRDEAEALACVLHRPPPFFLFLVCLVRFLAAVATALNLGWKRAI